MSFTLQVDFPEDVRLPSWLSGRKDVTVSYEPDDVQQEKITTYKVDGRKLTDHAAKVALLALGDYF
jgi:hypothetical protein